MHDRILLVLPPFFTPLTPPLGISILKTYLEQHGYNVTCFDFNTLAQQWNMHHQYFARLQSLESVTMQDGYSKLWHVLNDHMLASMNGTDAVTMRQVLPLIISQYGMRSEPHLVDELISIVERYFNSLESTFFDSFDLSQYSHVGTSTYTTSLSSSLHLLRAIKQRFPQVKTIMGGGVFADDLALGSDNLQTLIDEYPFVDHIIMGEGEQLLLKLIQGEFKDQRVLTTEDVQRVNLDMLEVPIPSFVDFNIEDYYHLTIEGARSCPFQCSFCSETIQWGNYRKKPAAVLGGQMMRLAERYGNNTFFMGDSLMNPYIQELSKVLLEKRGSVLYDGYLRADKPVTHRERTKQWAKSGLIRVRMGIESASPRVLGMMDKMTTPDSIAETLKSLANAGVRTTTYWIVGFPNETEEDFQQTLDFVRENYRYIYELEAHPHLYYPYGQVGSRLHESYSLYPEEVTRFTKFKKWEIVNNKPTREERFDRLRRFSQLAAELGLINIYTEEARYRAERRWHSLHPLVGEVSKGTALRRERARLPGAPLKVFSEHHAGPAREDVLCYRITLKKLLNEDLLRASLRELVRHNEMLQVDVVGGEYVPAQEETEGEIGGGLLSTHNPGVEPGAGFDPDSLVAALAGQVRPARGASLRAALVQGDGPPCDLLLLGHRAILDGRSMTLLSEDLFRIYEQLAHGTELMLLPVKITYSDFAQEFGDAFGAEDETGDFLRARPGGDAGARDAVVFPPGGTAGGAPQVDSTILHFGEELLGRIFAPPVTRYDLKPGEIFLTAIRRVLGRLSGAGGQVVFHINGDYRNIDERLARTVGALSYPRRLTCASVAGQTLRDELRQTRRRLRSDPRAAGEAAPEAEAGALMPTNVLLDLEYLPPEPWLGGDEWMPQGFETSLRETPAPCHLKIVPVCTRRGLEVHLRYENTGLTRALAEGIGERLAAEVVAIVDHCEHYVAAEGFWLREFENGLPPSALSPDHSPRDEKVSTWESLPFALSVPALELLQTECDAGPEAVIMAAYALLLSRMNGSDDLALLMAQDDSLKVAVAPVRLRPLGELSLREFVREVTRTVGRAMRHEPYVFEILSEAGKLSRHNDTSSHFDVGFQVATSGAALASPGSLQTLTAHPKFARDLKMILNVRHIAGEIEAECAYAPAHFERRSIESFLDYLSRILEEAGRHPDAKLEEIDLNLPAEKLSLSVAQDATEVFNFS